MSEIVSVIDEDLKRRASLSFHLNTNGMTAEPFENIGEFMRSWPRSGVILIHNERDEIATLVNEIARRYTWLPIVAFSAEPEPERIVDAVLAGAIGYAKWPGNGEALVTTLRNSATRSGASLAAATHKTMAMSRIERLTNREREILAGMVDGLSNREIGQALAISPRTVELHRSNLLTRIDARSSTEAIRLAIEASLPSFELVAAPDSAERGD